MTTLLQPPPVLYPARYLVDPMAFFIALIGGPLLFTAISFWIFFIPVIALVLGGPAYLVIGTPVLLWYMRGHDGSPGDFAVLAVMAIVFAMLFIGSLGLLLQDQGLYGGGLA